MLTPSFLDLVLWSFNHVIEQGWGVLAPAVMWMFWVLAAISLMLSCYRVMVQTSHPAAIAVASCFAFTKVLLFYQLMTNHQRLMDVLVRIMTNIGLAVGQASGSTMTVEQFFSPGTILTLAWRVMTPMIDHWNTVSGLGILWYAGPFVMYLIALLSGIVSFFLISLHVVTAITTYRVLSLFSFPLFTLGLVPHTSFIAQEVLHGVIACSVRLGVLALVCSIIVPLLADIQRWSGGTPDFWSALSTAAAAVLLSVLSWKAPAYASEVLSARIAATASDLLAMVGGAAYGATRLAGGGPRAARHASAWARDTFAQRRQATRLRQMWRRPA